MEMNLWNENRTFISCFIGAGRRSKNQRRNVISKGPIWVFSRDGEKFTQGDSNLNQSLILYNIMYKLDIFR